MKRFTPAPVAGRGKKEKIEDGDEPPVHIKEKLMRYGNTPEENERWRRDRKAAFPVQKKAAAVSVVESPPIPVAPAPAVVVNNDGGGLAAMFALYISDDDDEEEKEEPNVEAVTAYSPEESNVTAATTTTVILVDDPNELQLEDDNSTIQQVEEEGTAPPPSAPCRFFAKTGKCKFGDKCKYLHDKDSVVGKKPETVKKQTKELKLAAATHKFSKQALLSKLFIKVREKRHGHKLTRTHRKPKKNILYCLNASTFSLLKAPSRRRSSPQKLCKKYTCCNNRKRACCCLFASRPTLRARKLKLSLPMSSSRFVCRPHQWTAKQTKN